MEVVANLFFEISDFFLINCSIRKYKVTTIIQLIKALSIKSPLRKYRLPKNEVINVKIIAIPCKIDFML